MYVCPIYYNEVPRNYFELIGCLSTATTTTTTVSGIIILVGYMSFDAFTSNWQGELFSQHKMSSVQMMCGVNLFSCLLTTTSLIQQGTFTVSLQFMFTYPAFFWDSLILSVSVMCHTVLLQLSLCYSVLHILTTLSVDQLYNEHFMLCFSPCNANENMFTINAYCFMESVSMLYVLLSQLCSATGQLFIYYTISVFGPVVFTIIMTIRQVGGGSLQGWFFPASDSWL